MRKSTRPVQRIMMICIGNICRSPMAAAVMQEHLHRVEPTIEVVSAGLGALDGQPADAIAIQLMEERGLDITAHRAAKFLPREGLESDLILVMTEEMRDFFEETWPLLQGRVYRLGHWENFDVDDPHQRGEPEFRTALKSIDAGVVRWLEKLTV